MPIITVNGIPDPTPGRHTTHPVALGEIERDIIALVLDTTVLRVTNPEWVIVNFPRCNRTSPSHNSAPRVTVMIVLDADPFVRTRAVLDELAKQAREIVLRHLTDANGFGYPKATVLAYTSTVHKNEGRSWGP